MKQSPVQVQRSYKKREAQAKVLALIADGATVKEACAAVGRRHVTFYQWTAEDPDYKRKVQAIRLGRHDPTLVGMDFVRFRQVYFDRSTAPHHHRMIEAVERAEPDTLTLVLAFPEAAKTTLLTDRINYILGAVNPDYRFAVISEGQDLARKIVNHVAMRMTDESQFRAYIERFGPFKAPDRSQAKPWNADFFVVLQSHHDEKEPSLEARGAGSTLYGGRYDEMWLDDIQSERNLNQTPQLLRYIRQTVLTRPAKGVGKTCMVGSRIGPNDIYDTMVEEGMVDQVVTIPALDKWVDRDDHYTKVKGKIAVVPDCPAKPTWDYWSLLDLAKRRDKVGEEIWSRTYMQRRITEATATFTEEMLEKIKDRARGLGRNRLGTDVVLSVDPAFESGICAFMACAYSSSHLWVIDALERKDIYRTEDILAQIAAWAAVYRPSAVVVEQNNFQKGLARDSRLMELAERFGFTVISHQTGRQKNDPTLGVAMMASAFTEGEFTIPWGDDEAVRRMGHLVDELRAWRPRKSREIVQDLVMCAWFIWLYWEEQRQVLDSAPVRLARPSWVA